MQLHGLSIMGINDHIAITTLILAYNYCKADLQLATDFFNDGSSLNVGGVNAGTVGNLVE
jgi:hypothetical protein